MYLSPVHTRLFATNTSNGALHLQDVCSSQGILTHLFNSSNGHSHCSSTAEAAAAATTTTAAATTAIILQTASK